MPSKRKAIKPEANQVPVGTFCKLLRPNLWAGFDCLVEKHEAGFHLVRLCRMDGTSFLAGAKFEELEPQTKQL